MDSLLADVTHGAGPEGALGVEGFVVHRGNQDEHRGVARLDPFDQVDPVAILERDVDDDQVRVGGIDEPDGLSTTLGFTTDGQVGLS